MNLTENLPNVVREHMLKRGKAHTAIVLDGLYTVKAQMNTYHTIDELCALLSPLGISQKLIRSGTSDAVFRKRKRATGGRPAIEYYLPSSRQVLHWYMLYDQSEISDTLPVSAFNNTTAYRQALHVAMVARLTYKNGGKFKMARYKMSMRIGVCNNTIRNYERASGIEVTPYISAMKLMVGHTWELPAVNNNDHSSWLLIIAPNGTKRNYPLVRSIAAQAINSGCTVYKMTQHSNFYAYPPENIPTPTENAPPVH